MSSIYKQYFGSRPIVCGGKVTDSNFLQPSVDGIVNYSTSTTDGTRYIVGSNPQSNYIDAYPNQIATYFSEQGTWIFEDPYIGMEVINTKDNCLYRYNGSSWIKKLAFSPSTFDTPFSLTIGGTGASTPYNATENLQASHNHLVFDSDLNLGVAYVIPCFPLVNNTANVNNFCNGDFILKKSTNANNMFYRVNVTAAKAPTTLDPIWSINVLGNLTSTISACTFTKDLVKYFGIQFVCDRDIFTYGRFIGAGTHINSMTPIPYRNTLSGTFLNYEIKSSIQLLTDDTALPTKIYGEVTAGTLSAQSFIGKIQYLNTPVAAQSSMVLAVVADNDNNLSLQWVIANGGITIPSVTTDLPTESVLDGMTPADFASAIESNSMLIYDGLRPGNLANAITDNNMVIVDAGGPSNF